MERYENNRKIATPLLLSKNGVEKNCLVTYDLVSKKIINIVKDVNNFDILANTEYFNGILVSCGDWYDFPMTLEKQDNINIKLSEKIKEKPTISLEELLHDTLENCSVIENTKIDLAIIEGITITTQKIERKIRVKKL
ncbi:MAG: hypothetical protein IMY73_03915 [Bacteroidetes bacterium]|nr:hypothetical protein [Bacteroidota bacterium]